MPIARAVALYKPEHNLMTETRKSILPSGLGYTSGTGGVLELIEGLGEENLTIVSGFFEEPKRCDQLITKGYDPDLLYNAYKYNSISDRQTVANKLEDGVSGNIALAIGMDKCFNEGVVDDFTRIPERLGGLTKEEINPVKIGEVFDRVVQTTMVVRDHTNAIRPHIKRDTMAEANFNRSEKTMERTVEIAYEFVEELGAKVNPIIKQNFFNKTPTKSLEEAFDQASIEENFGNLRNPPPAFVGPRQFIGNYKR